MSDRDLPLFDWQPPTKLAIFPSIQNRPKINRAAIAAAGTKNPENSIRATVERLRSSLERKGLPNDLIERDVADLETALRSQVAFIQSAREVSK